MEALMMNMVVPAVLALVLSIFFISLFRSSESRTGVSPPEPTGRLPLIGHLGILPTSTPLHRVLGSLSDRYGPIFTLSLGQRLAVVITSSELAKECFTTNDRSLASRPVLYSSKILGYDGRMLGLAPYGTHWRDMHKLSTTELLSSQRIGLLKHVRIQEVDSLVKGLYKECCCRDSTGLIGLEMKSRLGFLTMNIVSRMVVGKRFYTTDGAEMNEEGREFHELIEEFFYLLGGITVSDALPWLAWLDVDGKLKAMRRVYKKMDDVAQAWVVEHRQKLLMRKEEGDLQVESSKDFMDVIISLLMDQGDHGLMDGQDHSSDVLIKSSALAMITAASDTTSSGLIWVLSLLLNNRDVLRKAQQELDYHVGKERNVEESDLTKLSYLHAVVKETLRLYPIGPLLVPHEASEPVEIRGFHITKGTMLLVNVYKIHRDPRVWAEPDSFKPERFLEDHFNMDMKGQQFELMPFGSGRRSCPGMGLALNVTQLTLARLLHSFDWSTPMEAKVDLTEGIGLALPKVGSLDVLLRPRLPQHLYV